MPVFPTTPLESTLKPVLFIHLETDGGAQMLLNASESLTVVRVTGGSIKSVDPAYPFLAEVLFGFDNLTTPSGNSKTNLDCRIYLKTPSGAGVYLTYGGVVGVEGKVAEVLTSPGEAYMEFTDGFVTANPSFVLDGKVEAEYQWVKEEILVARGRFLKNAQGITQVQYYVYAYGK